MEATAVDGTGELDPPMRRALELGWEAYRHGSFPVGAVICDADGAIVSEGRNRIGERDAPPGRLRNVAMAHAEMDALSQLPWGPSYREHTVHTSLDPCLLCRAAIMLIGVGHVRYLAPDPFCEGLDALADLNLHTRNRYPSLTGPSAGPAALFSATLAMATVVMINPPDAPHLAAHDAILPDVMRTARRIVREDRWPGRDLDVDAAIAHVLALMEG